jgi:hypothetical protein
MLPLLITGGVDGLFLIAAIVVASLIGKPLSKLNCEVVPVAPDAEVHTLFSAAAYVFRTTTLTKTIPYSTFVTLDRPVCYEIKAVWGLSITLCVLFAFSALVCVFLWKRIRRDNATPKDIEG